MGSSKKVNDRPRTEWELLIDEWVHNEQDRQMLKRRLLDGIIFDDLAFEFNLSVQQTKSRVYKAQKQLFKHL